MEKIGCLDLFFFASGSQAIHEVFFHTYLNHIRETGRTHVLTLPNEIAPILRETKHLEKLGCSCKFLPEEVVTVKILEEQIRARTALVSLSWVHPLSGVVQPIGEIGTFLREKEVLFHVDISHGIAALSLPEFPCDFITFEGTIFGAPEGTGGLFTDKKWNFEEEKNAAGRTALVCALEKAHKNHDHMATEVARLKNKLESALPEACVLGTQYARAPHIIALDFPGVHQDMLAYTLKSQGVLATPTHHTHSSLSFTLSNHTTEEEIDVLSEKIRTAAHKLKPYSACLEKN